MIRLEKYPDVGDGHITLIPYFYDSSDVGTWSLVVDTNCFMNHKMSCTSANGSNLKYKVFLAKGIYTLKTVFTTFVNQGIIKTKIDSVLVQTKDTYSAGLVENVKTTTTNITIVKSKIYTIELVVDGKNVASGGYSMYLLGLCFYRTA